MQTDKHSPFYNCFINIFYKFFFISVLFRRPHHHKGCRRTLPNTMKLSLRDGKNKNTMMTDYQSRFGNLHVTSRRQPIRPVQKTRDPNPPAMDFRTENHESYKEFNEVERLPACKVCKMHNYISSYILKIYSLKIYFIILKVLRSSI